jgi:hypothetical protein
VSGWRFVDSFQCETKGYYNIQFHSSHTTPVSIFQMDPEGKRYSKYNFQLTFTRKWSHILPLGDLNDLTKLLYTHLNHLLVKAKAKTIATYKIYMSQDYKKCLKHTVAHQGYIIGPYDDVYIHVWCTWSTWECASG